MSEITRESKPVELNETELEQAAGGRMKENPEYSMPSTGARCCYQPQNP